MIQIKEEGDELREEMGILVQSLPSVESDESNADENVEKKEIVRDVSGTCAIKNEKDSSEDERLNEQSDMEVWSQSVITKEENSLKEDDCGRRTQRNYVQNNKPNEIVTQKSDERYIEISMVNEKRRKQCVELSKCERCSCNYPLTELLNSVCVQCSNNVFKCRKCGEEFGSRNDLDSHECKTIQNLECVRCKRTVSRKVNPKKRKDTLYCSICKKALRLKSDCEPQDSHTDQPFDCCVCKKRFKYKVSLVRHLSIHSNERQFGCDMCKKYFRQRTHLVTHLRTHTGDRPFPCPTCNRCFSERGAMKRHLRTHSTMRPLICYICKERFLQRSELQNHLLTHSEEKRFQCPNCDQRFMQRSTLMSHLRLHSGEKEFECPSCKKQFSVREDLMKHMESHTDQNLLRT